MKHIMRCSKCKGYTMHDKCSCGSKVENPKPAKYSPDDAYGKYRRKAKELQSSSEFQQAETKEEKGLL